MIEVTPAFKAVEVAVALMKAPPMPVTLKPSPNDNFQVVSIHDVVLAYGTDPAELIDWATDSDLLTWRDEGNPAN